MADILAAITSIEAFLTSQTFETFTSDDRTFSAVVRKLEVIGEAARSVPESVKLKYPDIPWKEMVGMRDRLIHAYFGVNGSVVWDTAQKDLPALKAKIQKAVDNLHGQSAPPLN